MKQALLIETYRNQILEKQHFGFIKVVDRQENILLKIGDDENKNFWLRSTAKPFQASLIIDSGAYEKFGFNLEELAICCSSHAGTEKHIKVVESILNKIGLSEQNLNCGAHEPIDKEMRKFLIKNDLKPSQLHNNCSGKHAGMLAVCLINGWDIKNYLEINHPLQEITTKTIAKFCNFDEKNINIGSDGCSSPVHALPFHKMGVGYLNLFLDKKYENIKNAFQANPFLIGGDGRIDTEIIKASSGKLISKIGAGGLCITINLEQKQALIVKILDADISMRSITTIETLKQLKWLSGEQIKTLETIDLYNLKIKNLKNQIVGEIVTKPISSLF